MNNYIYLVKNENLVKSMVEKTKNIDHHTINTSWLKHDEFVDHFANKKIYVNNQSIILKKIIQTKIIYMYSRNIKNVNGIV
jgi:hypothetical protein